MERRSKRMRERLELSLPARIHCQESHDHEWVELTRLMDVTPFGARFSLSRPTESGRLLHMTLPMPRQLRCFDFAEQQYRIWALVRNTKELASTENQASRFEVGVAFIGQHPPASHEANPERRYEVSESPEGDNLWTLKEIKPLVHVPSSQPRQVTRHNIPVEVQVEIVDEKGNVLESESTVTENISRRGAAVFTSLNVASGRFVRLTSSMYHLSVFAVVRERRLGKDNIPRLHLEFIGREWPID